MKGRIAFVLYLYPLGVSSMIVNSIKMFADKGIDVDVYIDKATHDALPVAFKQQNINVIIYDDAISFWKRVVRYVHSKIGFILFRCLLIWLKTAKKYNLNIPSGLFAIYYLEDYLFAKWLKLMLKKGYDYICPVEAKSLIVASGICQKIIYYNMELLDWSVDNPIYTKDILLQKLFEYNALQNVNAVVIQNEKRLEQFRKINDYKKKMYLLPVASMGDPILTPNSFFRDKFAIPRDVQIVVYSGNIMPWAKCIEMVDSVKNWPAGFCLVLHTWRKDVFETGYGLEVKKHANGLPVYLSEDYLDIEDLAKCLSSSYIALMFYEPIDSNFVEILFSSNKLAEYLKAGLPVITSDFSELKKFISAHGIGETVSAMTEIPSAITRISENYDSYKSNVMECYQNVFRFEIYFEPLFAELYQTGFDNMTIISHNNIGNDFKLSS